MPDEQDWRTQPAGDVVPGVQQWMALDLWTALGSDPANFEAALNVEGWAAIWAELLATVRGLAAEIVRLRDEVRDAGNDLLNIRGILSPNGGPRVVPMDLGPRVAPAIEWLAAERDREHQRAEGWADQYNRVARQIADVRDERDTALAEAKQARGELAKTVSNFDEFVEQAVERRTDLEHEIDMLRRINRELNDGNNDLNQLVIDTQRDRDRRGDELRRAQAVISLLSKRIAVLRAEADEAFCTCESYDCHGECCGVGNCTCTTAPEAPVPP